MTTQPEILRLADALEQQFPLGTAQHYLDGEASAELRRLHAANQELLEALKLIRATIYNDAVDKLEFWNVYPHVRRTVDAAIGKHGGAA